MKFCTVINCMDGRIQIPVIEYLKKRFNVEYVDSITDAGPTLILAENEKTELISNIFCKIEISLNKHKSIGLAIAGHYNCAGNPSDKEEQITHIKKSIQLIKQNFAEIEIIGLWVNENWIVEEVA